MSPLPIAHCPLFFSIFGMNFWLTLAGCNHFVNYEIRMKMIRSMIFSKDGCAVFMIFFSRNYFFLWFWLVSVRCFAHFIFKRKRVHTPYKWNGRKKVRLYHLCGTISFPFLFLFTLFFLCDYWIFALHGNRPQ